MDCLSLIAAYGAAIGAVAAAIVSWWAFRKSRFPEVIAYLDHDVDSDGYVFVIENIGNGVAYDIHTDTGTLPVEENRLLMFAGFVSDIPMLPPGSSRRAIIWTSGRCPRDSVFNVVVRYSAKSGGKRINATYPVEYRTLQDEPRYRNDLQMISRRLQKLQGSFWNSQL